MTAVPTSRRWPSCSTAMKSAMAWSEGWRARRNDCFCGRRNLSRSGCRAGGDRYVPRQGVEACLLGLRQLAAQLQPGRQALALNLLVQESPSTRPNCACGALSAATAQVRRTSGRAATGGSPLCLVSSLSSVTRAIMGNKMPPRDPNDDDDEEDEEDEDEDLEPPVVREPEQDE
jgi:hypothetical protein